VIRLLVRAGIALAANAVGLLVAELVIPFFGLRKYLRAEQGA
jgi:hypothetical protein